MDMNVYAVAGGEGVGSTATACNLVVTLRAAGRHAAVLDAGGDVAATLGFDHGTALEAVLGEEAAVRGAITEHPLSTEAVPEADLEAYYEAAARDPTAFRAGDVTPDVPDDEEMPDTDTLPVVAGWGSADALAATDPDAANALLDDLALAYEVLVVDAGADRIPAVALADGVAVVTTPADAAIGDAQSVIERCDGNGIPVAGAVVNRADDRVSVSALADPLGLEVLGVIPDDERTASVEPVAFTAPDAPAAAAYERLADSLQGWSPPAEDAAVVTDGEGDDADRGSHGEGDDGGGFLSRITDRFG